MDKANQEYQADIDKYRKETAEQITANEENIKELKADRAQVENDKKDDYDKQIAELEQKDNNMKKKMDDYKPEGKEKWKLFKSDFNKGMNDLGKSIKDLTASNKKHN